MLVFTLMILVSSVLLVVPSAFAAKVATNNTGMCAPPGKPEAVVVRYVYDGDTVRLQDGRRVRLLGINTTETGKRGEAGQPFSKAARKALETLVGEGQTLHLYFDRERKDRYGRYLAHMYREGKSVERELLRQGLAYHVAIPPNLSLAECFAAEENKARAARRGLWSPSGIQPSASSDINTGGYQRFYGKVERVFFANAWWIELEGGVSAVIYPEHQHRFQRSEVAGWKGKQLELEGWVYRGQSRNKQRKGWRVKLETPYGLSRQK